MYEEEKQQYMPRPKCWTGWNKGIKFGKACCNDSYFGLVLPMYMDDLIIKQAIVGQDPFGGTSTHTVYSLPEELEDTIIQMITDLPKYTDLLLLDRADEDRAADLVGMFSMDVDIGQIKSFSRKTKIERYNECFKLNIYWASDGVAWSFGKVNTLMWNLRKMISKHIQSYKPVNYKRGKREVIFERKVACPQFFVDCDNRGNMTKLPF